MERRIQISFVEIVRSAGMLFFMSFHAAVTEKSVCHNLLGGENFSVGDKLGNKGEVHHLLVVYILVNAVASPIAAAEGNSLGQTVVLTAAAAGCRLVYHYAACGKGRAGRVMGPGVLLPRQLEWPAPSIRRLVFALSRASSNLS